MNNQNPTPENSSKKVKKKLPVYVIIIAAVAVVLAVGIAVFVSLGFRNDILGETTGVSLSSPDVKLLPAMGSSADGSGQDGANTEGAITKDIINILLLGTDMKMEDGSDPGRCDATVIASMNIKNGDIKLVSFERALGVPVPGYLDEKLNSILQYGGPDFMVETIENCFGVEIDGYVHMGYETLPAVIDAIGGIDIELSKNEAYFMNQYLEYRDSPELVEGMNHLNGIATWSYCRLRDFDNDYERQGRVRNAISAVVNKCKTLSVSELTELTKTIVPMVDTSLTKKEIAALIVAAPRFINAEISQLMVPGSDEETFSYKTGNDTYLLGIDFDEWAKKIDDFLQP